MTGQIQWLPDIRNGRWARLAAALQSGLPVPAGFVVTEDCREGAIRDAYNDLTARAHTHYVAVRGPTHAVIEILGNDRVVHALRAMWTESAAAQILVQSMINAEWCGKASCESPHVRIHASAGLLCLDPDVYVFDALSKECTERILHERPRRAFRGVDGTTRTMQIQGERRPFEAKYLKQVAELAERAASRITWALDDRRLWLLSTTVSR